MKRLHNRFAIFISICLLLTAASSVYGQTLDEMMTAAVKNRELIKQYLANVEKSKEDIRFVKGNFYPSIDVGYRGSRFDGNSAQYEDYEKYHATTSSMTLNVFSGLKDYYDLKAGHKLNQIENFNLNGIEQDIKRDVALAFLLVHRDQAFLNVAENAYRLLEKEYKNALLKYEVGIFKKNDALKIKVQMDDSAQTVNRSKTAVEKSLNNLKRIVAGDLVVTDLDFSCFNALPDFLERDEYEPLLLSRRSELNALRTLQEAAQFRVKSARSAFYPQADLSTSYLNAEDDYLPGSGDESEHEFEVQLKISLNIFDGFQKYATINKAKLDVKNARYDLAELERELKKRLKNILLDLDVAFENLKVAQSSQAEAEENLRITQLQFQKGVTTSTEILDAISFLARAQFNVIDARTRAFENHFNLTRMIEGFRREIGQS